MIKTFPDKHGGHTHYTNHSISPWLHEDEHSDQFHIHLFGIEVSQGKPFSVMFHAIIFTYYMVVLIVFLVHCIRKPKIVDSLRD